LGIPYQKEGLTMRGKWFVAGLLAAMGVLAWGGSSRGGDTIRLNMVDNTPTKGLVDNGQGADTLRTWHHHFGWGWGHHGWGWGGFYRPYWGWGGFYRPYWGWGGFYRPYWAWGGWGPYRPFYGLGFYRPYYSFGFGYGVGFGGLFWPWCAGASANVYNLNLPAVTLGSPLPGPLQPRTPGPTPRQLRDEDTFPYDGGPSNPAPNPKDQPPSSTTPPSVPLEGRAVSLPKAAPKWTYPAYGQRARRTTPASERTYLTRGEQK
jgi:hypothetical protein